LLSTRLITSSVLAQNVIFVTLIWHENVQSVAHILVQPRTTFMHFNSLPSKVTIQTKAHLVIHKTIQFFDGDNNTHIIAQFFFYYFDD